MHRGCNSCNNNKAIVVQADTQQEETKKKKKADWRQRGCVRTQTLRQSTIPANNPHALFLPNSAATAAVRRGDGGVRNAQGQASATVGRPVAR